MERPLVSSMASWTTSEFDDDSKSELGGLPPTPSEVAFKIQRERANVAREGSRLQLLDYEAQRAHSESALRKAVPFKPPPPTRYESYQGILGGSNRRDAALLTLAEVLNDGVPREKKLLAPLWRATDRLERIGFEAFGIERTQSEKTKTSTLLDVGLFWLSANTTAATFASGSIGAATFGLNFRQGVPVIVVVNMIAVVPAAYFSTFGVRTGFRQMVFSRFSFGYWVYAAPGVLNLIAQTGWSAVNAMIGAQTLWAASMTHHLPPAVGVAVLALGTLVISTGGHKYIIAYGRWAWIPPAIAFIILAARCGPVPSPPSSQPHKELVANSLSFSATVAGYALGWSALSSDYSVRLPSRTSSWSVFFVVYCALVIPLVLVEVLGLAWGCSLPLWYLTHGYKGIGTGIGGLLGAAFSSLGRFGSFLTVVIGLSSIANNVPNLYSFALTVQTFGKWPQAVPRLFLTILGTAVYMPIAITGVDHFSDALVTLLTLLAYWVSIYCAIVVEEHLIFRRGRWSNYDFGAIGKASLLPPGIAAFVSICIGTLGALMGMSMDWYTGPIGRSLGFGDIGFELALIFTLVTYAPVRYLEKWYFCR